MTKILFFKTFIVLALVLEFCLPDISHRYTHYQDSDQFAEALTENPIKPYEVTAGKENVDRLECDPFQDLPVIFKTANFKKQIRNRTRSRTIVLQLKDTLHIDLPPPARS